MELWELTLSEVIPKGISTSTPPCRLWHLRLGKLVGTSFCFLMSVLDWLFGTSFCFLMSSLG